MPIHKTLTPHLALFFMLMPGPAGAGGSPADLNQAQLLVFMNDHLEGVPEGRTLVYGFSQRGAGRPDRRDEVRMTVTKVRPDARRDLSFEFLSGPDRLDFPPARGYRGNPIALQFLERDIRDMARATGGSPAYFRNRIRKGFNDPLIESTRVTLDDSRLDAVEIRVTPFKADSRLGDFDGYSDKQYRFLYSEQVHGGLISIRTRMSGETGAAREEELAYSHMTPGQ